MPCPTVGVHTGLPNHHGDLCVQRGLRTGARGARRRPSPSLEVWEGFLEEGMTGRNRRRRAPVLARNLAATPFPYLLPGSASAPPWAALRAPGASPSAASPLLQGWASTPGAWPGRPLGGASAQPGRGHDHLGLSQGTPIGRGPNASPLWPAGLAACVLPLGPSRDPGHVGWVKACLPSPRPRCPRGVAWLWSGCPLPTNGGTGSPDMSMSQLRLACNRGASSTSLGLPKPVLWPAWEGSSGDSCGRVALL